MTNRSGIDSEVINAVTEDRNFVNTVCGTRHKGLLSVLLLTALKIHYHNSTFILTMTSLMKQKKLALLLLLIALRRRRQNRLLRMPGELVPYKVCNNGIGQGKAKTHKSDRLHDGCIRRSKIIIKRNGQQAKRRKMSTEAAFKAPVSVLRNFFPMWLTNCHTVDIYKSLRVNHEVFWKIYNLAQAGQARCSGNSVLAPEMELAMFLYWLATCDFRLSHVSVVFGVDIKTADGIIMRQLNNIHSQVSHGIQFPSTLQMHAVGLGFATLSGSREFRNVAGALGTLELQLPGQSIRSQLVADHRSVVLNIFSASTLDDVTLLRLSPLYKDKLYPKESEHILLAENIPCMLEPLRIVTPFVESEVEYGVLHPEQVMFNEHHSMALQAARRAVWLMTERWPAVFQKVVHVSPRVVPVLVSVCAFIHNVCIVTDKSSQIGDVPRDNGDSAKPALIDTEMDGSDLRDRIVQQIQHREGFELDHDYV